MPECKIYSTVDDEMLLLTQIKCQLLIDACTMPVMVDKYSYLYTPSFSKMLPANAYPGSIP